MVTKRKTIGKYKLVSVSSATQDGAKRRANKYLKFIGEKGWKFVGATPAYKDPDVREYIWHVSYRKRVNV